MFDAISILAHESDEVILFDPAHDVYEPEVTLDGITHGVCRGDFAMKL